MLDRDTNHPAIILWGFFNEGQSDRNESCPSYAAMASTFKTRDPTRLVSDSHYTYLIMHVILPRTPGLRHNNECTRALPSQS